MHLGIVDCSLLFLSHCDLDLAPLYCSNRVRSISHILYDIEIPNIIGVVEFCTMFKVTVTLTSGLSS